jgi:hypothetical protein
MKITVWRVLATCCLAYTSTLKMDPVRLSENVGMLLSDYTTSHAIRQYTFKVNLSLFSIKHHAVKTYVVWSFPPWSVALYGFEWSASRPVRFTLGASGFDTCWIGGWVGPGDGLDAVEKRKFSCPYQETYPDSSGTQPVSQSLYRLSYQAPDLRWSMIL